jgi:hypothetical protein
LKEQIFTLFFQKAKHQEASLTQRLFKEFANIFGFA